MGTSRNEFTPRITITFSVGSLSRVAQSGRIEQVEKHLIEKRKSLLQCLLANNWRVVGIDGDTESDWAVAEKWLIESTRENRGAALTLWMFKYAGLHDGIDRVVATPRQASQPNAYGGAPAIEFDARKFERQLDCFMEALHEFRTNGTLTGRDSNEKNT
jgi:hypothetical protein